MDSRINLLLKYKYTNSEVTFDDVFPNKIDKTSPIDYILDRTLLRPRDAIVFVNECFNGSQGKTQITNTIVYAAEKAYSLSRMESLQYEWFVEHPALDKYMEILSHKSNRFKVSELTKDNLESLILQLMELDKDNADIVVKSAHDYYQAIYPEANTLLIRFTQNLLFVLYKVGAIGIKLDGASPVVWVHDKTQDLTPAKIKNTCVAYIHKMLWRVLAIDKNG